MSLPMQIHVNGGTREDVEKLQNFLKVMGVPTTLEEIGFPKNEKALDELVDYIYDVTFFESKDLKRKIREGMEYLKKENW